MPEFVGVKIQWSRRIANNSATPPGCVRLSAAQARLLPPSKVMHSLDTTDKGGKGQYAKRWYRWYAPRHAVWACARSTPKMLAKADLSLLQEVL